MQYHAGDLIAGGQAHWVSGSNTHTRFWGAATRVKISLSELLPKKNYGKGVAHLVKSYQKC